MKICTLFLALFTGLQELPFKPADEFKIALDYEFRERPRLRDNPVYLSVSPTANHGRATVLPHLTLQMTFYKFPDRKMRMRVTADHPDWKTTTRRVSAGETYPLTLGYIADMVDRVTAQRYIVTFLDAEKEPVNCIVIRIDDDGSFYINDEKRGSF